MQAGDQQGFELVEASLALAEAIPSPIDACRAYINLSALKSQFGDQRKAHEYAQAGAAAAERWGVEVSRRWFSASADTEYGLGEWDEALRSADAFLAEVEAGSPHYLEHAMRSVRALIRFARGDVEGARSDEGRALEQARSLGNPQALEPILAVSAFLHAELGERDVAEERFLEGMESWRRNTGSAASTPSELPVAALSLGRTREISELGTSLPTTRWSEAARTLGDGDFAGAAQIYHEIGFLPHEAYVRLASGQPAQVQRALEFYRSVGATHFVERARALLPASA
jgi:tetratricopeptide (TPR) repeat protein